MKRGSPISRSEEAEPDHLIIAQDDHYDDWPVFPPARVFRSDRNDLFLPRNKAQQVIP
jgi:hypothetical protein